MATYNYNEKFNSRETFCEEEINSMVEKLKTADKLEVQFQADLSNVDSIYSPVQDNGGKLAKEATAFYSGTQRTLGLELAKLENIHKKLNDVNVKVALFGDVSAGKSQTINSILGRKLFVPAYCHTTICFVRISLSEDGETIKRPGGEPEVCDNEDALRSKIKDCANFNGKDILKPQDVLEITLVKKDNDTVMRKNVALYDCPGGNDTQEVTDMIEKVVLEADIFLYILTQVIFEQQRVFFNQLLTKTSAPNIFVLVNKWDETDNDAREETEKAFKSLKAEIVSWLTAIDADNKDLCEHRIFFISAKETLQQKMGNMETAAEGGKKKRLEEFTRFETVFSDHLEHPREIKVAKHIKEFDKMDANIGRIKDQCAKRLNELRRNKESNLELIKEKMDHLESVEKNLCEDTEKKVEHLKPEDTDKFSKEHLKLIETEFGNFVDVLKKPGPSIFGAVKSVWTWGKKKVWDTPDESQDVMKVIKGDVAKSMLEHIKREAEIIRAPLKKEFNHYDQYIKSLPKIENTS